MARRRDTAPRFRKPLQAAPLRAARERHARRGGKPGVTPIVVALPLAAFTAVFLYGVPSAASLPLPTPRHQVHRSAPDREAAHFARCHGPVRVNCIVDGDTFWYDGRKIRIADINTPEVSEPDCPAERALGERATDRLLALLNQGPFTLEPIDRNRDRYGRLLRTVTRDGASLGEALVGEGLAEEWKGYRGSWC
jgi:endonuclease YncB( thermonuclease family)